MSTPLDGRQWVTPLEETWLEGKLPDFLDAQKNNKKYHKFWPGLFRAWFAEFPLRAITPLDLAADVARMAGPPPALPRADEDSDAPLDSPEEEAFATTVLGKRKRKKVKRKLTKAAKAIKEFEDSKLLTPEERIKQLLIRVRQEQLKSWMRRHAPAVPKPPRTKTGQASSSGLDIFNPPTLDKPGRAPQESEVYIDLYLSTRIRPAVKELARERNHQGPQINLVREVARELWKNEDEETRAAVATRLAAHEKARIAEEDALARAQTAVEPTPEDYQLAIDLFPQYANTMLKEAVRRTGFCATLILGGPVPNHKGSISTLTYHVGKDEFGSSFGTAHPTFNQDVISPFIDFLRTVYPPEVRSARAIKATTLPKEMETIEPDSRPNSPLPGFTKSTAFTPPVSPPMPISLVSDCLPQGTPPSTRPPTPAPAASATPVPHVPSPSPPFLTDPSQPTSPLVARVLSTPAPSIADSIPPIAPINGQRAPLDAANPSPRLSRIAQNTPVPAIPRPKPRLSVKVALRKRAEEEKLAEAERLAQEEKLAEAERLAQEKKQAEAEKLVEAERPAEAEIHVDAVTKAVSAPAPAPTASSPAEVPAITAAQVSLPINVTPVADSPLRPTTAVPNYPELPGAAPKSTAQASTSADGRPRRQITLTPLAAEAQREKELKEAAAAAAAAKKAAKLAKNSTTSRGRGEARGGQRGARGGQRGARGGRGLKSTT
ncbi:hypothetical protein HWV62_31177 [Athelia sp. TMB]|nr:hypothetical protein HWV62_31177 [Athelia sp. TMB]